jgi:predicted nucleic acid-binding protein
VTAVLVDSNVLLDVITQDPHWGPWSSERLEQVADQHPLVINPLIYAEVSLAFDTIEALEQCLPISSFRREPLPWEAGFLAGRAFLSYRRRGGPRRSPMPDFYIGAHAAIAGHRVLTRDTQRYRGYFPTVALIAPDA